jgi:hypothetical protein
MNSQILANALKCSTISVMGLVTVCLTLLTACGGGSGSAPAAAAQKNQTTSGGATDDITSKCPMPPQNADVRTIVLAFSRMRTVCGMSDDQIEARIDQLP